MDPNLNSYQEFWILWTFVVGSIGMTYGLILRSTETSALGNVLTLLFSFAFPFTWACWLTIGVTRVGLALTHRRS